MGGGSRRSRSATNKKDGGRRRSGADSNRPMALNTNEADVKGDKGMDEVAEMSVEEIQRMNSLLDDEMRVMEDEEQRLTLEQDATKEKTKKNKEKIKEKTEELINEKIKELELTREKTLEEEIKEMEQVFKKLHKVFQLDQKAMDQAAHRWQKYVDMLENSGASADPFLDGQAHGGFAKATAFEEQSKHQKNLKPFIAGHSLGAAGAIMAAKGLGMG